MLSIKFKNMEKRNKMKKARREEIIEKYQVGSGIRHKSYSESPFFTCTNCSYITLSNSMLARHIKTHSAEQSFKCVICDRFLKTEASLRSHINNMHFREHHKTCKYCKKEFKTNSALMRHIRYMHDDVKAHKCNLCHYSSVEFSNVKGHMRRIHSKNGDKLYKCPQCFYTASNSNKLDIHVRTHTGNRYKCQLCEEFFTKPSTYRTHKLMHDAAKFQCDHCKKKFSRKYDLTIHIGRRHASKKSIKCNFCETYFTDKHNYKLHVKVHDAERFRCNRYYLRSTTEQYRRSHITMVHTDVDASEHLIVDYPEPTCTDVNLTGHEEEHVQELPYYGLNMFQSADVTMCIDRNSYIPLQVSKISDVQKEDAMAVQINSNEDLHEGRIKMQNMNLAFTSSEQLAVHLNKKSVVLGFDTEVGIVQSISEDDYVALDVVLDLHEEEQVKDFAEETLNIEVVTEENCTKEDMTYKTMTDETMVSEVLIENDYNFEDLFGATSIEDTLDETFWLVDVFNEELDKSNVREFSYTQEGESSHVGQMDEVHRLCDLEAILEYL